MVDPQTPGTWVAWLLISGVAAIAIVAAYLSLAMRWLREDDR